MLESPFIHFKFKIRRMNEHKWKGFCYLPLTRISTGQMVIFKRRAQCGSLTRLSKIRMNAALQCSGICFMHHLKHLGGHNKIKYMKYLGVYIICFITSLFFEFINCLKLNVTFATEIECVTFKIIQQ